MKWYCHIYKAIRHGKWSIETVPFDWSDIAGCQYEQDELNVAYVYAFGIIAGVVY